MPLNENDLINKKMFRVNMMKILVKIFVSVIQVGISTFLCINLNRLSHLKADNGFYFVEAIVAFGIVHYAWNQSK